MYSIFVNICHFIYLFLCLFVILVPERVKTAVQWDQASSDEWYNGIRVVLNHFKEVKQVNYSE